MTADALQHGVMTHPEQQWQLERRGVNARNNRCAIWLLVAILATAVSTGSCAGNQTNERDDAISECRRFHTSNPETQMKLQYWTGTQGENFGGVIITSSGGWELQNILSIHALEPVEEDSAWTTLCVGLVDTTSYTRKKQYGDYPVAWATFHTLRQVPIGLVRLQTFCWLITKHFSTCSPSFMPLPYMTNLPLYNYSPLEESFWSNLTVEAMNIKSNWIWRINTKTNQGSIPAQWVSNMQIPSLKSLQILGNNWKKPEKLLKDLPHLEDLDLSFNKLEAVPEDMFTTMPALQKVILGHNNISIYPQSVSQLSELWLLDLTNPLGNATLKIEDEDVEKLPKSLMTIGLENTILEANVTAILLLPNLRFLNLSGCALGYINDHHSVQNKSELSTLDLSHNNLTYLPQNIFKELPKLKTLVLTNNSLEEWPEEILVKNSLTHLYLSHNHIKNLTSEAFEKYKNLKKLDLSWNEIEYISNTLFQNTNNLTNIDISHNKIAVIPNMLFNYTPQLSEINLSYNMLQSGPNLWKLQLETLDLSHNNLTYFASNLSSIENIDLSYNSVSDVDISPAVGKMNISHNTMSYITPKMWIMLTQLDELDLGSNDFECCQFGNRTYLNEPHNTVILNLLSKDPLTCTVNRTSPKILLQTFVYNETECNLLEEMEPPTPFGIAVVLPLSLLIVTGTLIAVMMYVYRFELTYVSHLFRMKKIGEETDEQRYKTCVYDAFVCYSAKNFEWVMRTLLPGIEGGPEGYRLCVHDRDFALGAGINRNIVASLEKSRKVIFVLSADFIASKWCQWELEMANHKMFEEKRNYIILVELERLPRRSLPRHLRYLMDRTTYLEWPEGIAGVDPPVHKERESLRRLREALGASLRQRTGRDNEGFFTVLDAP